MFDDGIRPCILALPDTTFNQFEDNMRTYYTFTYCDGNNQIEVMITDKSTGSFCEILRCPIETVLGHF